MGGIFQRKCNRDEYFDVFSLKAASVYFIRRLYLYFLFMDKIFLSMDKAFLSMDKTFSSMEKIVLSLEKS